MKIQLLHTKACHGYHRAVDELEEALKAVGMPSIFEIIRVDTQEEAEQWHFFASPTILLEGEDIDRKARQVRHYGISACRPYFWDGKPYDFPPREMIIAVLREKLSIGQQKE